VSDQQSKQSLREGSDTEYKYLVHIIAIETFVNMMRRGGIDLPLGRDRLTFTSPKIINMKALKESGIIWSYSIIRVRSIEEIVEEG
jgi:hypothetical protein